MLMINMAIINHPYNLQIANRKSREELGVKLSINNNQITSNLNREQLISLSKMVNNKEQGLKISGIKEIKLIKE